MSKISYCSSVLVLDCINFPWSQFPCTTCFSLIFSQGIQKCFPLYVFDFLSSMGRISMQNNSKEFNNFQCTTTKCSTNLHLWELVMQCVIHEEGEHLFKEEKKMQNKICLCNIYLRKYMYSQAVEEECEGLSPPCNWIKESARYKNLYMRTHINMPITRYKLYTDKKKNI